MAVLITGGHGHIGSWAAYHLAKAGERVVIYDRNQRIPDYLHEVKEQVEYVRGDVMDFPRLTDTFRQRSGQIDGIIHTVGIMGEIVQANPYASITLNVVGTVNILEVARQFEVPKVVYTSTGAVYGPLEGIATEAHPITSPDLYTATKVSSEYLGQQYARTYGFEFRIARLFFCYGPGKIPSTHIRLYQMAFGALEGMHGLTMDRGGDQKLDFTYIEDAGRGTALLYRATQVKHQAYNIATGTPTTVGFMAELSQKYSRHGVKVELGSGDLMRRAEALDISLAREDLGYVPQVEAEEGVQRYAAWLERNL